MWRIHSEGDRIGGGDARRMAEKDFKVPKRASGEDLLVADKVVLNIHEDAALIEAPPPWCFAPCVCC